MAKEFIAAGAALGNSLLAPANGCVPAAAASVEELTMGEDSVDYTKEVILL
ncbi:hypothetical protein [Pseudomonas sp. TMP25]|uniref:hypothetical protein n=1 Tax=Pseudomonas sp. TMP25 TaxID=3136561 RepID=UPI0031015131